MLVKILMPDFEFSDERGQLVQLIHEGFTQFNVIYSIKGTVRGNHYHKINREAFYIISGKLALELEKDGQREKHIFQAGDMFGVDPFVMHSFYYSEDTWLASMYDIGVELKNGGKDIYE